MTASTALTPQHVETWLAGYKAAWENRDADAAAALFTPDAQYFETPHAAAFAGQEGVRDYWAGVTADQRDVEVGTSLVAINGNTAVARWSSKFRLASNGANVALDGVFVLEFGQDGQCAVLREWWHAA